MRAQNIRVRRFARWALALGGALALAIPLQARDFRFSKDSLAFANETVFHHPGMQLAAVGEAEPSGQAFNRRCFVVCRAVLQFYKFARFDPNQPAPDDAALARLIRRVTRRPVWRPALAPAERIVIPGYANLRALSARRAGVVQQNVGLGWPTYVRPGNFCYVFPPSPAKQKQTVARMDADLRNGQPTVLWLTEFPSFQMNHTVLVLGRSAFPDGQVTYTVYDPNYADQPRALYYWPESGKFFYPQTFYAYANYVKVRAVYRSPWQ